MTNLHSFIVFYLMIPVLGRGGEIHTSPGALITATAAALVFSLVDGARQIGTTSQGRMGILVAAE